MSIHIAASGESSRMRADMVASGLEDMPKHLLPAGNVSSATLLGNNIRQALASEEPVVVHVNDSNAERITRHSDVHQYLGYLTVVVDPPVRPLGPFTFMEPALQKPATLTAEYSIAGDVYIEGFDWNQFIGSHQRNESVGSFVSFLAAYVDAPAHSAIFETSDTGKIQLLRRAAHPLANVLRNVGVYGFTSQDDVKSIMNGYLSTGEHEQNDVMVQHIIKSGLAHVIKHEGYFANMNTLQDYQLFLHRASERDDYTEAVA